MDSQAQTQTITIAYHTAVLVDAGWRSIEILALARPVGRGGFAEVVEVIDVDGNDPVDRRASRTGAKRQSYSPAYIAGRELGKRKRVSACQIVS